MRVAVTGATGFVGSHLCRRLAAEGHEVVALRRRGGQPIASTAETVIGDVTDRRAVARLVRGCDAVFHAAAVIAYGGVPAAEYERVNVEGTRLVARCSRAAGVGRLVQVSSVAAIGIPRDREVADEEFTFNLEGGAFAYHLSKRRAEDALLAEVAQGLDAVIVNPSSLLGPHGSRFRGAEVPDAVARRPIVPHFTGGTNVVHVDDVVDGMLAALERGTCGRRYILGGENHDWRGLARIAAEEIGVRRVLVPAGRPVLATAAAAGLIGLFRPLPPATRRLAARRQFYRSARACDELGYRYRPYREIVREYVDRVESANGVAS